MTKHVHGGDVYRYENYLDFSANCNPLGTPERVKEAIRQAADSILHYPDVRCEKLTKALAEYENVSPQMLFIGNGAAEVIFSLCLAKKPKKALLLAPTFAEYEQALRSVDCEIRTYLLEESKDFALGEDFLKAVEDSGVDMLFICNPNNPTGVLTSRQLLRQILEVCTRCGIFLVVDECFQDFIEERDAYTLKGVLPSSQNLFLLKAFTKRYAIPGVRLGYGITGNEALLEKMEEVTQPWNVSGLAQAAGLAALQEEAYVTQGRELIFRESRYLKEQLQALGMKVYPSSANYIFFQGVEGLAEKLHTKKILIRDCSNYKGLEQGYYRIAVRNAQENQKLIEAIREIIKTA